MAIQGEDSAPRAMIHKRILDSAAANPEVSMAELASEIAGASPDLVERVLEEYGDPAESEPAAAASTQEGPMTDSDDDQPEIELTDGQREALEAIREHPDATQSDLADRLGLSPATVNKRVNAIDGFEWDDRRSFVSAVLDGDPDVEPTAGAPSPSAAHSDGGELLRDVADPAVEQLQERLARLEQALGERSDPPFGDTELAAKVVRAVVADERIDEEEELLVLEALL